MSSTNYGQEVNDGDLGLRGTIKKLEEAHLKEGDKAATFVPTKIRDIVTTGISPIPDRNMASPGFTEENRLLTSEVSRLEDLLAATRAERDEVGSKYMAVSERLEQYMKSGADTINKSDSSQDSMVQQVAYLKQKLEEEHGNYKRKLQAYQDGQQRQAQLVQKLQSKVLQYKRKCGELESSLSEKIQESERKLLSTSEELRSQKEAAEEHSGELEDALIALSEEKEKNALLQTEFSMLHDKIDTLVMNNQELSMDLEKMTNDWKQACEELKERDDEEQNYFANEHSKLLSLWQALTAFRRQFSEMKTATSKDLSMIRADVMKSTRSVQSACMNLERNVRGQELSADEERTKRQAVEEQLREKVRETIELQNKFEAERSELHSRVKELIATKTKLEEEIVARDAQIDNFKKRIGSMEDSQVRVRGHRHQRTGTYPGTHPVKTESESEHSSVGETVTLPRTPRHAPKSRSPSPPRSRMVEEPDGPSDERDGLSEGQDGPVVEQPKSRSPLSGRRSPTHRVKSPIGRAKSPRVVSPSRATLVEEDPSPIRPRSPLKASRYTRSRSLSPRRHTYPPAEGDFQPAEMYSSGAEGDSGYVRSTSPALKPDADEERVRSVSPSSRSRSFYRKHKTTPFIEAVRARTPSPTREYFTSNYRVPSPSRSRELPMYESPTRSRSVSPRRDYPRYQSPSPSRSAYTTAIRARSPSPPREYRTSSYRTPSPVRLSHTLYRSPSPSHVRRSASPTYRTSRYRSPSPYHEEPRTRSPMRAQSPSQARELRTPNYRTPSPTHKQERSPYRHSQSPVRHYTQTTTQRTPSPIQKTPSTKHESPVLQYESPKESRALVVRPTSPRSFGSGYSPIQDYKKRGFDLETIETNRYHNLPIEEFKNKGFDLEQIDQNRYNLNYAANKDTDLELLELSLKIQTRPKHKF